MNSFNRSNNQNNVIVNKENKNNIKNQNIPKNINSELLSFD